MKRNGNSPLGLYTLGIAALFLAGFLLLVTFGARTYRDAAAAQAENNRVRAMLSYLSACVKSSDSAGRVRVEDGEDGPVLVVGDGSGYALHIYRYGGNLVENYSAEDGALRPDWANVIGPTEVFRVEKPAEGLLRVTTDAGDVLLRLRSGEGQG